jgi:ribosome-binding protein aMBF1 (putative translation factor)
MRLTGEIVREGTIWVVDIPILNAMTQGKTRSNGMEMAKDLVESLAGASGFEVTVHPAGKNSFEISSTSSRELTRLILKRQRQKSGLSLSEVAKRLGSSSRNAYARYEQGVSTPSIEKLDQLLQAVSPDRDLLISQTGSES